MLQQLPPAWLADALWPGAARLFFQPCPEKKKKKEQTKPHNKLAVVKQRGGGR